MDVNPEKLAYVEKLPARMAHALHALLEATREHVMPVTAQEIMIYDWEAMSPQGTGAALREAQKRGLAVAVPGGYWVATNQTNELRYALEDRALRDQDEFFDR